MRITLYDKIITGAWLGPAGKRQVTKYAANQEKSQLEAIKKLFYHLVSLSPSLRCMFVCIGRYGKWMADTHFSNKIRTIPNIYVVRLRPSLG